MAAFTTGGYQGNEAYNFGRNSYTTIQKYSDLEVRLATMIARGSGYGRRRMSATLKSLIGAAAGGSKLATERRRKATAENFSVGQNLNGLITMETYTIQSGVSTSADVTRLQTILSPSIMPTFPANKDAVGSGGRTNAI